MAPTPKGAVEAPALIGADDSADEERIATLRSEPNATGADQAGRISDYNAMVRNLKAQPTVRIKTPAEGCTVVINGWRWDMPGGERLEVPQQVADLLEDAGYI